ncbi:CsiV family protein [Microbulbifer sp. ZKSA006]|uniref:CsiV family protein n=1 Tax=Microbulbifer sp. ZKSA006 TaxID=3243390 RepID=UPI004039705F
MKRIISLCSTLALTLAATSAQAVNYAGNTFEIEMIVFERPQGMENSAETWPAAPRLQYPSKWVDFATPRTPRPAAAEEALSLDDIISTPEAGNPSDLEPAGLEGVPGENVETRQAPKPAAANLLLRPVPTLLNNKAAAISRAGDKILFHRAWRQVLKTKRNSPAILIDGGSQFSGHSQLEGFITLSVARYLHISTNLWLNDFYTQPGEQSILLPQRPQNKVERPLQISTDNYSAGGDTYPQNNGFDIEANQGSIHSREPLTLSEPEFIKEAPLYVAHAARLQHERRLRSGQLHYIDHPAFGILIEVRTVAKPKEDSSNIDTPANELSKNSGA